MTIKLDNTTLRTEDDVRTPTTVEIIILMLCAGAIGAPIVGALVANTPEHGWPYIALGAGVSAVLLTLAMLLHLLDQIARQQMVDLTPRSDGW